ncbi:MAG: GNAT family protein [Anaerolineae bacterium]
MFPYRLDDEIEIRPLAEPEAVTFFAVVDANRARLYPWMAWVGRVRSVDDARIYIRNYPKRGGFHAGIWQGARLLGGMACPFINHETHEAEFGYWLAADVVGKGIVTRAAKLILRDLFEQEGMRRIELQALVDNVRSRAVAERLGFRFDKVAREEHWLPNEKYVEHALYVLTADDWRKMGEK